MSSFLILCNNKPFWITFQYVMKSGFYMTTSNEHLSGCSKKIQSTSQSQTFIKNVHDHCLADCGPSDRPLHLTSILSKSLKCTRNCNAWSQYWSIEKVQFSMIMPDCTSHNQCFKSWVNWSMEFCLIHHIYHLISHQLTTSSSGILKTFLQGKCFCNQQDAENASQDFTESLSMHFYVTEINQLIFLLVEMCLL